MEFVHAGLGASSQQRADAFYAGVLGLAQDPPRTLDRSLSQALFGIDEDLPMLNYRAEGVHFEIFVLPGPVDPGPGVTHACLRVADPAGLVDACQRAGAKVIQIPKGDKTLTFVADLDGNLFEIKG